MVLNFSGAARWPGFAATRANIADNGAHGRHHALALSPVPPLHWWRERGGRRRRGTCDPRSEDCQRRGTDRPTLTYGDESVMFTPVGASVTRAPRVVEIESITTPF